MKIVLYKEDGVLKSKLFNWGDSGVYSQSEVVEINPTTGVLIVDYSRNCDIWLNPLEGGMEYSFCGEAEFNDDLFSGRYITKETPFDDQRSLMIAEAKERVKAINKKLRKFWKFKDNKELRAEKRRLKRFISDHQE